MDDTFWTIWNELVLCTQFTIYGDKKDIFDAIETQTLKAKEEQKITNRQFIILINAVKEWRDILGKSGGEEIDGEETESNLQISDPAE